MFEPEMTRAERRRQKKGIFPCLGCGKRKKLKLMMNGYCKECADKFRKAAQKEGLPPAVHLPEEWIL